MNEPKKLGFLDRYLTLLIFLAMLHNIKSNFAIFQQ